MNLVIVVAPHFVAGLLVGDDDRVLQTAPILAYMRGWEGDRVRAYVKGKGWRASRVVNGAAVTVGDAVEPTATGVPTMHNVPNPNDPNNPAHNPQRGPQDDAPGAPHTPEAPRQSPRPDDGDSDNGEA